MLNTVGFYAAVIPDAYTFELILYFAVLFHPI